MTPIDISRIEQALMVSLPTDLREFLCGEREDSDPDEVSIMGDPEAIIELTKDYRAGYMKLPPWPETWVYLGDEADACPYCIDCVTGKVTQLHKGNRGQEPLASYGSFTEFREARGNHGANEVAASEPSTGKGKVFFYLPAVIAMILIFVVIPICLFGLSLVFNWIFN